MTDLLHSTADLTRRLYTGNGQTYAFHILAFVVAAVPTLFMGESDHDIRMDKDSLFAC